MKKKSEEEYAGHGSVFIYERGNTRKGIAIGVQDAS